MGHRGELPFYGFAGGNCSTRNFKKYGRFRAGSCGSGEGSAGNRAWASEAGITMRRARRRGDEKERENGEF